MVQLAEALGVSESTIRRDLDILAKGGQLERLYGGAMLTPGSRANITDSGGVEDPFVSETRADFELRRRMAAEAAALVDDGDVVVLDIGSTTPLVARELRGRPVTIITSNLAVLDEVRGDDAVELVLLGGVLRRNQQSLVGPLAEQVVGQLSADVIFLSCTGVRGGRVLDNMAVEAPIKQALIAASHRIVLLASEIKFPGSGRCGCAPWTRSTCSSPPPAPRRKKSLRAAKPAERSSSHEARAFSVAADSAPPTSGRPCIRDQGSPRVTEVALYDVDEARLATITTILEQFAVGFTDAPDLRTHTDLESALEGSRLRVRRHPGRRRRGTLLRRARRARSQRARPGDHRTRRSRLRAAHRAGDARHRRDDPQGWRRKPTS